MSRADHAKAFLTAVDASWELATRPEVRAAWGKESACAGMTVGGLTHHLLNQAGNTARGLRSGPGTEAPIAIADHYARAAWVGAAPDAEVNVAIRDGDNARAEAGPDAVLADARELIEALPSLLDQPRDPDLIVISWQGWALTTSDFLITRMMEMVVHGDDLAVSVGVATPAYQAEVLGPVIRLLTGVALRRHGQDAVVRTLSRPQRAPSSISAF
jgi:hypothetical protein